MRLEHRRVLNASPLVPLHDPTALSDGSDSARGVQINQDGSVTIDAGRFANDGIADVFHVTRNDGNISVSLNGDEVFNGQVGDVTSLTIHGSSDADHLDVDLGPTGLAFGAIRFDGGESSSTDTMTIRGAAATVDHTLHGDDGGTVVTAGLAIDYDGVEILRDAVSTAHRNLQIEEIDAARLSADDHGLSLEADGRLLRFDRSDDLSIDFDGGGANRFDLIGLGDHDGDVTIAGDDADRVTLSGRSDLDDNDLLVSAGTIELSGTVHSDGGDLRLHATSELTVGPAGVLDSDGGFIELNAGRDGALSVAGHIDVSDEDGLGGEARLLGDSVRLTGEARIDADGRLGGGVILVGGDYQGANDAVLNALRTTIERGAILSADAIDSGDGGQIIIWSDGATHFAGAVLARGGRTSGDGGFAEVSGQGSLAFLGSADLSATLGNGGTLLLDPKSITVVETTPDLNGDDTTGDDLADPADLDGLGNNVESIITAGAIETILAGGQSLILTASDRIDIDAAISVTTGTAGLTLIADVVSIDAGIAVGGTFEVRADNLHIDASIAISAGTVDAPGLVVLTTNTADVAIDLGGADVAGAGGSGNGAVLGLTNAELATLSAGVLRIGSSTAGAITLTTDIVSPADVLELVSGGAIESADPALATDPIPHLTASALLVTAGGDIRLEGNNSVGTLAGSTSTEGAAFEFVQGTGDLVIGTVSGVAGIVTNAGTISLTTGGDLAIDQHLVSGGQAITVSADGVINLDGVAEIDAGSAVVTIADGTLGGTGTVTGHLLIAAGATISPGDNLGTLTVDGDLTLAAGSTSLAEIDDHVIPPTLPIAGTTYDQIVVTGDVTIETGAILSILPTASTAINPADGYIFITSGGSLTGSFVDLPDGTILTDFGGSGVNALVDYATGSLTVQVIGPIDFVAPDDDAGNDLRIVRNGTLVEFFVDGELVGSSILAALESITVTGADGEDDSLTIDYSGGFFGISVTFDGGTGGHDELILVGGTFESVTHTFENANDGRIDLVGVGIEESVVYTGLEPIVDNLAATNRIFTFNGGAETITVSDAAAVGETTIDSTLGESVTFVNPTTSLTINAGDGDDVVEFASVDAGLNASLTIDGGDGNDEIRLSTALTLGSLVAAGHLDVTGELIVLGANVSTDGGAAAGDVTLTGAVVLASDVAIDTDVAAGTDGSLTVTGTLDADLETNSRSLTVTAGGGNVEFQAAVGSGERLDTLTLVSAHDVTFSSTVHLLGGLSQSAGTGTTIFRGGTIGGILAVTTDAVEFAAATTAVTGTATVTAATSIAGGTVDGVADLAAGSIILVVTEAAGTIGATGTALEIATAGTVDADTSSGNGDIVLTAIGDLRLGFIDAGTGNATLTATAAIVDALAGDGVGVENVRASTVELAAATGIGATDAIDTAADTLHVVNTVSGDIRIAESDGVSVTLLAQRRDQPEDMVPGGSILLTAGGAISVDGQGVFTEGAGGITLQATANLVVNAAVIAGSDSTTEAGPLDATDVALSAGQDVTVNAAVTAERNVTITAGRDIDLNATATAGASGATTGAMRLDAGRNVSIAAVGAAISDDEMTILAGTGSISLGGDVTAGATNVVRLVAGTIVTQTGGAISGAQLGVIAGGDVSLLSATNNVDVFAGSSTGGDLAFADADGFTLNSVAANDDFAGASGAIASTGDVTLRTEAGLLELDADVIASATGTVRLSSGGSINQSSGAVSGENLGAIAAGAIALTSSTNDVDTIAASAGDAVSFRDADGFSTGTLGASAGFAGASGVTGQDVSLRAETGSITLTTDVNANAITGIVRVSAEQGAVEQTGGRIVADALGVRAGAAGVTLTSAANDVAQIAADSGGAILYRDATGFTVGTVAADTLFTATTGVQSSDADVTLRAGTGLLTLDADVSAVATGTIRLTSLAGITQSSGAITAANLGIRAAGDVSLLSSGNDVDTFAAVNTAALAGIAYRDLDDLSIGFVAAAPQFAGATGLSTTDGDVLLVTGLGGAAGNGSLTLAEAVSVGSGTVRINADGSVSQNFGASITASGLGVRADGTVTLFDDGNDVATFAAVTDGGAVMFQNQSDLTVGSIAASATTGLFAATAGIITTGGGTSGADVLLVTGPDGPAGDGALAVNAAIVAGTGTVRLTADGNVSQLGGISAAMLGVRTSSGDVSLLAANDVDVFAALTAGGAVGLYDVDDVTVGTVPALFEFDESIFPVTSGIVTNGGDVTLVAGQLSVVAAISSSGGDILLQVDDVDLQAAVDATNLGLVQVTPRTDGQTMTLGGAGGLSIDSTEIDLITARLLAIGGVDVDVVGSGTPASAGRITIAGTLSPANVQNLSFLTAADVFGSSANSIDVTGAIVFDVGTGVSGNGGSDGTFLGVSASDLAGRVRNAGEFRVSSAGDTVVGLAVPLDPIAIAGTAATGLTGITTQGGTIALEALGGSLTIAADLAVQGAAADIILNADGATSDLILNASVSSDRSILIRADRDIVQASTTDFLAAAGVRLSAGGDVGSALAAIDLRAGTVTATSETGSVFLNEDVEGGGLTVGTVAGSSGISAQGLVHVTTEAGDLAVAAAVNAGQVLLESGTVGTGSTNISAAVTATGAVEIDAASQLSSTGAGTISGSTADLTAAGGISLDGKIATSSHTTIVSLGAGVGIAAADVGGTLTVNAGAGDIGVDGAVNVAGLIDFDATAGIGVVAGGSLNGNTVDLLAAGEISLGGPVHADGSLTAVSTEGSIVVSAAASAGGNAVWNAMLGSVSIGSAVSAGGMLDIDAGGGISVATAGLLKGGTVDLHANAAVSLLGTLNSTGNTNIVSVESGIGIATATVGGQLVATASAGGIEVSGTVIVTGAIDFDAGGTIAVTPSGAMQGNTIDLTTVGLISLAGPVTAVGHITAISENGSIGVHAPVHVDGPFVATAHGGDIVVSGPVVVTGLIDFDAANTIAVAPNGALRGSTIDLAAGSQAIINGPTTAKLDIAIESGSQAFIGGPMVAGTNIAIDSGGPLTVGAAMAAGGLVHLRSLESMNVMPGGSIGGTVIDVAAQGVVLIAGPMVSHSAMIVQSVLSSVDVSAPLWAGAGLDVVAGGGNLTLRSAAFAGGQAQLIAAGDLVVAGGSVTGHLVNLIGAGTTVVAGRVSATLDATIVSGSGGLTTGGPMTAGRTISLLAGGGNLLLGGNVIAGQIALLQAPVGSVLQPSANDSVIGPAAIISAGGAVGMAGAAIDLAVGQIAATAAGGGVWLNQQAAGGTLTIGILGSARGILAAQTVALSTENGDLVLAAPVKGSTIALTANREIGPAGRGRVLFDRGYAETPTGRIVAIPPQNIPVDANGVPITRFDLASPFVVTFNIIAGNVVETVDGVLGDRGVTVTVDFVQPEIFDPSQSRFQSITDGSGDLVETSFGPFSFQYSELFLQERLILSGARRQLFDILITVSQDSSISIAEQIGGRTVVDPTRQTLTFGNVSTSPTEQSLSIPLGVVSPVLASIEVPEPVAPERLEPAPAPTPFVAVDTVQALEIAAAETSGASAGATSGDRPRLFLVWQRPGDPDSLATIEIDLIWFARDYQRQLIGYLKEGRYWFELAEPGSPPRQLGDSFYVRNGLVIDDPAAGAAGVGNASDVPFESSGDAVAPPEAPALQDSNAEPDPFESTSIPASAVQHSALAAGVLTLLDQRRRRRFTTAHAADRQPASLGRLARLSRRVRHAALTPKEHAHRTPFHD